MIKDMINETAAKINPNRNSKQNPSEVLSSRRLSPCHSRVFCHPGAGRGGNRVFHSYTQKLCSREAECEKHAARRACSLRIVIRSSLSEKAARFARTL
jgi:hypothetical protein